MRQGDGLPQAGNGLVSYFSTADALRSRSVGDVVLAGRVEIPAPPARLRADWGRELSRHVALEAGDVEAMPLARARARWPDYGGCVRAVAAWAGALGLPGMLDAADVALMACRGARYHHDGEQYGGAAFCNLFLCDDDGQEVHFPALDRRIPLTRGTVLIFDTCQPHGVIRRGSNGFDAADFPAGSDGRDPGDVPDLPPGTQLFLTWELPIDDARLASALHIAFDVDPLGAARHQDDQLRYNGERAGVCASTGRWRTTG